MTLTIDRGERDHCAAAWRCCRRTAWSARSPRPATRRRGSCCSPTTTAASTPSSSAAARAASCRAARDGSCYMNYLQPRRRRRGRRPRAHLGPRRHLSQGHPDRRGGRGGAQPPRPAAGGGGAAERGARPDGRSAGGRARPRRSPTRRPDARGGRDRAGGGVRLARCRRRCSTPCRSASTRRPDILLVVCVYPRPAPPHGGRRRGRVRARLPAGRRVGQRRRTERFRDGRGLPAGVFDLSRVCGSTTSCRRSCSCSSPRA